VPPQCASGVKKTHHQQANNGKTVGVPIPSYSGSIFIFTQDHNPKKIRIEFLLRWPIKAEDAKRLEDEKKDRRKNTRKENREAKETLNLPS
jgi:hypothetical protein